MSFPQGSPSRPTSIGSSPSPAHPRMGAEAHFSRFPPNPQAAGTLFDFMAPFPPSRPESCASSSHLGIASPFPPYTPSFRVAGSQFDNSTLHSPSLAQYQIPESHLDVESQQPQPSPQSRFEYSPSSFGQRLLVGIGAKNKLDTSKIVNVSYRGPCKYGLLILLLGIALLLTPRLLPRWFGFEWASPQDLCQAPDDKLQIILRRIDNMTRIEESRSFLETQKGMLDCMNNSAAEFFHGPSENPPRFLWPEECTSDKAQVSLTETNCVSQSVNTCTGVGGLGGFLLSITGSCNNKEGPDLCTESTNEERTMALLDLEKERTKENVEGVKTEVEPIASTANTKVQDVIARLIFQVDIASNAFILYSLISIAIGIPLVVYKREKSSRIVGATFGLTKATFVIVFVVAISVYDSGTVIVKETDFPRLFQNFLNDPCYVDPDFSRGRVHLIMEACNNISTIARESDQVLQNMDGVFYDTRLFGLCTDESRELAEHPKLKQMDQIRGQYRSKELQNPGECNATDLDQRTSEAPEDDSVSKFKALFGSGVIAQLMLKFIVTGWILHLFAFIEPMVLHNGKVEVWGSKSTAVLNTEEQSAVTRFARDKHLFPLILFSVLLLIEVLLVIYSVSTAMTSSREFKGSQISQPDGVPVQEFLCDLML